MPKKSKSIFRQPGAQHFQLVHRSQRDPLINDPDAAPHVFREVGRANERKTGTISDLEQSLPSTSLPFRPNEGQATLYGVYYDDTSYDYMQHLRGIDEDNINLTQQQARRGKEEDIEAIFVPAPRGGSSAIGNIGASNRTVNKVNSYKGKGRALDEEDDGEDVGAGPRLLPAGALPSREELSREQVLENQRAIPSALQGFQPDMNPHLRQVLEALEDEAFVIPAKKARTAKSVAASEAAALEAAQAVEEQEEEEGEEEAGSGDEGDDAWFEELLGSGEKDEDYDDEGDEFEFREEGIEDDGRPSWFDPAKGPSSVAGPSGTKGDVAAGEAAKIDPNDTWADFKRFKASGALSEIKATADLPQNNVGADAGVDRDDDYRSEAADTITSLPMSVSMSVIGGKGKKRRKGMNGSDASGYSMSSSSMFRNKGLTTLDEMFEKVERDYEDDGDDFPEDDDYTPSEFMSEADDTTSLAGSTTSFATASTFTRIMRKQQLARNANGGETEVSREDFEAIMDDFLEKYEVVGKKMVPVLEGASGADKLKSIRRALIGLDLEGNGPSGGLEVDEQEEERERKKDAEYIRKRFLREDGQESREARRKRDEEEIVKVKIISGDRDAGEEKWDVETVLSTKSNLENHPRLIGATKKKQPANGSRFKGGIIREEDDFDDSEPALDAASSNGHADDDDDDETSSQVSSDGTITTLTPHTTVSRPRNESKEDKKARKASVKADRGARRVEKKQRQELFSGERRKMLNKEKKGLEGGRAADLSLKEGVNVVRLS